MAKRKQDVAESPTIPKFFRLASPKENEGSSSEGVKSAELEMRPTDCSGVAESTVPRPAADTTACITAHSGGAESTPAVSSNTAADITSDPDIGSIIRPGMNVDTVTAVVNGLTNGEKYNLLTKHFQPTPNYPFQRVYSNGCFRQFQYRWLTKYYLWLVYSKAVDGGFCMCCALFASSRNKLGVLVNRPFTAWIKVQKIVDGHAGNKYHSDATHVDLCFQQSIEKPQGNIDVRLNSRLLQNIHDNRQILKCCAEAILFCGRQCIALRGDVEKVDVQCNPGNFLAMMVIANHSDILKKHLEKPCQSNATYLSPDTQNKLLDIIGKIIQKSLVDDVKQAKFFTILVNEVTSFNTEIMPLCV